MNLSETNGQVGKVLKEGLAIKSISKPKNSVHQHRTVKDRNAMIVCLAKMSKMAISAGKTVTNCQFSPKMSIKTYMLKTAFSQKSEKY